MICEQGWDKRGMTDKLTYTRSKAWKAWRWTHNNILWDEIHARPCGLERQKGRVIRWWRESWWSEWVVHPAHQSFEIPDFYSWMRIPSTAVASAISSGIIRCPVMRVKMPMAPLTCYRPRAGDLIITCGGTKTLVTFS